MAQFLWTEDLYTGNSMIDGDHRQLISLVNALFEAMQNSPDSDRMRAAMQALVAYTGAHFGREEEEMERVQYVASLAHKAEHATLLDQLGELAQRLDAGGKINIPAVSDFLSTWLRDHILTADIKLAAVLKRQRSPAPQAH
jgi:hemerythrin